MNLLSYIWAIAKNLQFHSFKFERTNDSMFNFLCQNWNLKNIEKNQNVKTLIIN